MIKNKFYRYRFNNRYRLARRSKIPNFRISKFKLIILGICIIIMLNTILFFPHFFRSTYIVTIANKQIKTVDDKKIYLIYTQMENGDTRVFKNTNSLLEFKFDSEDIYGGLRINRTYEIKAYGFRIPLTEKYENIAKIKGVK